MWNAFLIAFVVAAAIGDVGWGKISRKLMVFGFLCGLGYHLLRGGLLSALVAALLGFAAGMVLFQLGAIGGGDVKLITALGAMLGLHAWLLAMYIAILAAGVMALVQIMRRGTLRQTLGNLRIIVSSLGRHPLQAHPYLNVRNPVLLRSPFGVAAALGTLIAVMR